MRPIRESSGSVEGLVWICPVKPSLTMGYGIMLNIYCFVKNKGKNKKNTGVLMIFLLVIRDEAVLWPPQLVGSYALYTSASASDTPADSGEKEALLAASHWHLDSGFLRTT